MEDSNTWKGPKDCSIIELISCLKFDNDSLTLKDPFFEVDLLFEAVEVSNSEAALAATAALAAEHGFLMSTRGD